MWSKLHPTIEDGRRGGLASQTQVSAMARRSGLESQASLEIEPWRLSAQVCRVASSLRLILASRCQVGGGQPSPWSVLARQPAHTKVVKIGHFPGNVKKGEKKGKKNHKTSVQKSEKTRFCKSRSAYFQKNSQKSRKSRFCGAQASPQFRFWVS